VTMLLLIERTCTVDFISVLVQGDDLSLPKNLQAMLCLQFISRFFLQVISWVELLFS